MALSKILKNRQLRRESLSLWYWTVMMLSIEKSFKELIFAGFKKTSKANIDARQNNWTFRGWRGMHDALIIPLVHLKSLVISLFHLKKIITENDKKTLLLFLAQRQPPFHNSPERDGGVESREWLHYWFQRQNFGYVGILIRFFP